MGLLKNLSAVISWYSGLGYLFRVFAEPERLFIAYHAIGETDPSFRRINISPDNFKKHIRYLRSRGYEFHYFRDARDGNGGKRAYLYFDDGLRSVRECVYPFLKKDKIPIEEAMLEMKKSKEIIEQKLSVPVVSFSYPKGRSSRELEQKARIIGYTITTADSRFRKIRPDPHDSAARFQWKMLGI